MVSLPFLARFGWRGPWGGTFHFAVLLSLSSRYYSSSVATRTASLGPAGLLMSVLPLFSCVLLWNVTLTVTSYSLLHSYIHLSPCYTLSPTVTSAKPSSCWRRIPPCTVWVLGMTKAMSIPAVTQRSCTASRPCRAWAGCWDAHSIRRSWNLAGPPLRRYVPATKRGGERVRVEVHCGTIINPIYLSLRP